MQSTTNTNILLLLQLLLLTTYAGLLHLCAGAPQNIAEDTETAQSDADAKHMAFYRELDNVTDLAEFIDLFVDRDTIDPQLGIEENLKRNVERAAVKNPIAAGCMPDNEIVSLTPLDASTEPGISYFPSCTRVKRCSGCCNSKLMSCQPVATETKNFQVTKYRYGEKKILGRVIVPIEEHTKCICDCRIKAEDCNSYFQVYRPELCSCACTNNDAREKCITQDLKIWDEPTCKCVCRNNDTCTTGTKFDGNQCACVPTSTDGEFSKPTVILDRRRFILKAIPVEQDNSTIYEL